MYREIVVRAIGCIVSISVNVQLPGSATESTAWTHPNGLTMQGSGYMQPQSIK